VSETLVRVPETATGNVWGDWAILRAPPPGAIALDLTKVRFVDPLFLLRLRGFIDWHCQNGHEVRVVCPQGDDVRKYLARMHLSKDLPASCDCDLPVLGADATSDILIPIRRLRSPQDGERLEEELSALYEAHFTGGLTKLAAPFTTTVSELCDNATTHGRSKLGVAYVAARRYGQKRCVLVIGDLGIGVPAHIRRAHPHLKKDDDAIREATKEGMTGTGSPQRGVGYQYVIDALKDSEVRKGDLRLWSGNGRFRLNAAAGTQKRRQAWAVENPTAGTWVRLELKS